MARKWMEQYQTLFIFLVVFCGGCYPALLVASSHLFGISFFESGLSKFELTTLSNIRVVTTVFTENVPQLFVQIAFTYSIGFELTQNTLLAFSTSLLSIIASILSFYMNRDKQGQAKDVYYYLEIKLKTKNNDAGELSDAQKKHIKRRRSIKLQMAKAMRKAYAADIDEANFEIGFTSIRKNNFVIRCCQHIHENEVKEKVSADELAAIRNKRKRAARAIEPFKEYCRTLYMGARSAIEDILFAHYHELPSEEFDVRYHKEFPKEIASAKQLNAREILKQSNADQSVDFDDLNAQAFEFEHSFDLDVDPFYVNDIDLNQEATDDERARYMQLQRARREQIIQKHKKKQRKDGGDTRDLIEHRKQFKKATKLLWAERNKLKAAGKRVGAGQIEEFAKILRRHGIEEDVIVYLLEFTNGQDMLDTTKEGSAENDESGTEDSKGRTVYEHQEKILIRTRKLTAQFDDMNAWWKAYRQRSAHFIAELDRVEAEQKAKEEKRKQRVEKWKRRMSFGKSKKNEKEESETDSSRDRPTTPNGVHKIYHIEPFPSWFNAGRGVHRGVQRKDADASDVEDDDDDERKMDELARAGVTPGPFAWRSYPAEAAEREKLKEKKKESKQSKWNMFQRKSKSEKKTPKTQVAAKTRKKERNKQQNRNQNKNKNKTRRNSEVQLQMARTKSQPRSTRITPRRAALERERVKLEAQNRLYRLQMSSQQAFPDRTRYPETDDDDDDDDNDKTLRRWASQQ